MLSCKRNEDALSLYELLTEGGKKSFFDSDVALILKGVVKHGIYGKSVITGYILSWVVCY